MRGDSLGHEPDSGGAAQTGPGSDRPVVRGAVLSDLTATILAMPVALFPLVEDRFGGSPQTLGLVLSSVPVGGVVASVLSSTFTNVQQQGRLMLASTATWGASLAAFALVQSLALALAPWLSPRSHGAMRPSAASRCTVDSETVWPAVDRRLGDGATGSPVASEIATPHSAYRRAMQVAGRSRQRRRRRRERAAGSSRGLEARRAPCP